MGAVAAAEQREGSGAVERSKEEGVEAGGCFCCC